MQISRRQKPNYWPIVVVALFLSLGSCQKQELPKNDLTQNQRLELSQKIVDTFIYKEGTKTILGQSRNNPYTVENMKIAWN